MLRKLTPYLFFVTLGLLMLTGARLFPSAVQAFYHVVPSAGPAASSAEIAAGQQSSGWVPSATVASKFISAAGAYLLAVVLMWQVQKLTHPGPTRWAKEEYTVDFAGLSPEKKFEQYSRIRLHEVLLIVGSLLFAALVV